MKKVFLSILLTILPILASAETVEIDGIWYNLVPKAKEAEVVEAYLYPSDNLEIPASVTYNEVEYSVTSIGGSAFLGFTKITSVTIPNTVTSIGKGVLPWKKLTHKKSTNGKVSNRKATTLLRQSDSTLS